jgi:aminopeptidase N
VQWRFETTRETILPALALGPNRAQPRGLVQVDVPPRTVDDGGFIAEIVEDTIRFYAELLGPYPFDRLGVSPISDNAGVGLGPQANIFLPESFWLIPPDALEAELVAQVTSHEVAHQYFFNLVHIIDNGEGWMSEAFAEYAATRFSQARTGTLDHALGNYWDYVLGVPPGQDAAINSEEVDLRPGDIRQRIIYFKGSALLHQIGQRLPDFDDHLRAYVAAFSEEIVTTRDFIDFMDDVSDSNIGALIRQWTQRPGLPYLQVTVQRPRDGSDELTVSVVQTQDGRRFDAAVPWVAEFEDGSTARVDVAINLPVDSTLDVGRAQSNTIDPDLSIFRRVVAEPAGDINLSGVVDGMDLLDSLSNQGLAAPTPQWNDIQDVNRDLVIDANDTRAILRSWGAGW